MANIEKVTEAGLHEGAKVTIRKLSGRKSKKTMISLGSSESITLKKDITIGSTVESTAGLGYTRPIYEMYWDESKQTLYLKGALSWFQSLFPFLCSRYKLTLREQ